MSVYSDATAAYRETTKWLTAFVPVAGVAAAAVLVAPRLVLSLAGAVSAGEWLARYALLLLAGLVLVLSVGAILAAAGRVLSVEPMDVASVIADVRTDQALTDVIGQGAVAPWFFERDQFDTVRSTYDAALVDNPQLNDDPREERLAKTYEVLRDWTVFHQTRRRFTRFVGIGVVAALVAAGSVVAALSALGSGAAITEPVAVLVAVDSAGEQDLRTSTGCTAAGSATFTAVGGTWTEPRLAVDGAGCAFGAIWSPDPRHVEVRPAKAR